MTKTISSQPTNIARLRARSRRRYERPVESAMPVKTDHKAKGMRILLIEDDMDAAEFIRNGLTEHGYVVDHAREGRDGLFLAAGGKYDVMVIDRMLPGFDGLSVVKTLRATGNQVPAVFLTTMSGID